MTADGGRPWLLALAKIWSSTTPDCMGRPEIVGAGNSADAALAKTIDGGSIVFGGVIRGLFGTVRVGFTKIPSCFFVRDFKNK